MTTAMQHQAAQKTKRPSWPMRAARGLGATAAFALGAAAAPAQAGFITNDSGLLVAHQTQDFESVALPMNAPVSNQFQAQGLLVTNGFGNPDSTNYANMFGNRIGNFQGGIGNLGTMTLDFDSVLSAAAFALVAADEGTATLSAYLQGVLVETASVETSTSDPNNYFGFEGILFDRLTMSVESFDNALMIDNLQTAAANQVPEPASWALVGAALLGLGAFGHGRKREWPGRKPLPPLA